MNHTTVQIGKHTFVSGLTWVSLTRPRDFKREALDTARQYQGDVYCIRRGESMTQVGIGNIDAGAAPRQIPLAATIASVVAAAAASNTNRNQRLNDWLGVFPLPDGQFAFVAVRDGAIMAQGDFIGSYEEALEHVEHHCGIGGWSSVLGPAEMARENYHNFLQFDLGKMPPTLPKGERIALRTVAGGVTPKKLAALGIALLVAGGAGMNIWQEHQREQAAALIAAQQAELATLNAQSNARKVGLYPKRWQSRPDAEALAIACLAEMRHLRPGGWMLDVYTCNERVAEALFVRGTASTQAILDVVPQIVLDANGSSGVSTTLLTLPPKANDVLPRFRTFQALLVTALQRAGVEYQITEGKMPELPPMTAEEAKRTDMQEPGWREHALTVGPTTLGPAAIAPLLGHDAVRLSRVSFSQNKWTYEGTIYAQQ